MAYEASWWHKERRHCWSAILFSPLFFKVWPKRLLRRTDEPRRQGACQPKLWILLSSVGIDPVEKNLFFTGIQVLPFFL